MSKKYKKVEIELSAPLILRLFEYIKEHQPPLTDVELHQLVENLTTLSCKYDDMLTMDEYNEIIKKPASM